MNKNEYVKIMSVKTDGQLKRTRIGAKRLQSVVSRPLRAKLSIN